MILHENTTIKKTPVLTKLHIGCGRVKKEGFINIDKSKDVNPDIVVDIEQGLPFKDNSFDYIYSRHTLEHIRPFYWEFVLDEMSRIAKDGCILDLILPFDNVRKRTEETHYRTFSWTSFRQLEAGSERNYYSKLCLKRLHKIPHFIFRAFFYFLPTMKKEINFKFEIIKDYKKWEKENKFKYDVSLRE